MRTIFPNCVTFIAHCIPFPCLIYSSTQSCLTGLTKKTFASSTFTCSTTDIKSSQLKGSSIVRQEANKNIKKESIRKDCFLQYTNGLPHLNHFDKRLWPVILDQLIPFFIDQFMRPNRQLQKYSKSSSSEWSTLDTPAHLTFLKAFTKFTVSQLSSATSVKCYQGDGQVIWSIQSAQEDMKIRHSLATELDIALMFEATKAFLENITK